MALLGVILAVGLLSSAAFFAQAVDLVILRQELQKLSQATGRLPFATRVYVLPSSRQPLSLAAAERVGRNIGETLSSEVGLPLSHLGIQVESGSMMLLPKDTDTRYGNGGAFLEMISLVYVAGIADHIAVSAGDPFVAENSDQGAATGALDVWIHTDLADKMGIAAGETFDVAVNKSQIPRPIRIAGLWEVKDPKNIYWFNDPNATLRNALLVHRQDYTAQVEPMLPSKSRFAAWHLILDDSRINPAHARDYFTGFNQGMAIIDKYLPSARLDVSPLGPLEQFVQRQGLLTILLLGFNVPALGILLYFLILISIIIAHWQRRETAILVSRGMGMSGILGMTVLEELLLFALGFPLGLGFGMLLAQVMGYTVSFLSFTSRPPLPVSGQGIDVLLILVALGFSLLARVIPAARAASQSVVEQEREHARPLGAPFWQRAYLDFLLVLPTAYAYRQLADRGTLAMLVQDQPEDLFRDPLLILVPALFVLTTALLIMRLFPLVMRVLDLLASRAPWLSPHLALRQLGRHSQGYVNPLLLVIASLALGIYTLSMAASLDRWLVDRVYYSAGADVTFLPSIEGEGTATFVAWEIPTSELQELPGITAATRVGDYRAELPLSDRSERVGRFLAVDRLSFPAAAWFRSDFADTTLGDLMNQLALAPDHVLVSRQFLRDNTFRIGEELTLRVALDDVVTIPVPVTIAGTYDYFPTVYRERTTIVGNLDYLFFLAGTSFPHHFWLQVDPNTSGETVLAAVQRQGILPALPRDTRKLIAEEQAKMERVGVFGTLSVGFLAATSMAILALLVHSYASLQERLYQFGVLRALGLMRRQILSQIVLEYGVLTAYGAATGALIGGITAQLFTPFFRVTGQEGVPLPPLIPIIAHDEVTRLAAIFVAGMIVMEMAIIARAFNRRVFDALRMGHQG